MARILVVDDDPDVLNLVVFRLRRHGHDVMSGDSGADALAVVAERGRPDLAVLDVNMPGMSGFDLLPKAKAARPGLPVIMVTAYGDADTRRRALESGAADLLPKPIDFAALRAEVDRRLAWWGAGP